MFPKPSHSVYLAILCDPAYLNDVQASLQSFFLPYLILLIKMILPDSSSL